MPLTPKSLRFAEKVIPDGLVFCLDVTLSPPPLQSHAVGVGRSPNAAPEDRLFNLMPVLSPNLLACAMGCSTISVARGVGNKEDSVPSVRSSNGTSRNKHRLDGIS